MIITKRALPRRTFLRGLGTTLALPVLDAMVPALSALAQTPAKPVRRLGFVYLANGVAMNGTAGFVFKLCDGQHSLNQIIQLYCDAFQVDADVAKADVGSVLALLSENEILAVTTQ